MDHLCRVRHCVNPDHLEPVTAAENTRRGLTAPENIEARRRAAAKRRGVRKPLKVPQSTWDWVDRCKREGAVAGMPESVIDRIVERVAARL